MNSVGCGKKHSLPDFRYCYWTCLEVLNKTTKHLSQDMQFLGQDLSPGSPKQKAVTLSNRFAMFGNKHSDTAINKWKVKQWSTVEESKHKIRETSRKVRKKSGKERKEKKSEWWGKNWPMFRPSRTGSCHSGSHDNLPPSPVLWIIHGVLDDTCDVTCSQATYQASVDCKDYRQQFQKIEGFSSNFT
jgi:hypothetical protein